MLRSSKQLQAEISLLERILEDAAVGSREPDEFDRYSLPKNRRRLEQARRELAEISDELQWAFDGAGVFGDAIAMKRLFELAIPLRQTLHWTGRDLMLQGGKPPGEADVRNLVEPVVTGVFEGSFGLKIGPPRSIEQVSFAGSIFDQAASRVVAIFAAAHKENAPQAIAELVSDLRLFAVEGLKNLTHELVKAGKPSVIRWRKETVVTVSNSDAELLYETLAAVTPTEYFIEVSAVLIGADYETGFFHLQVPGEPKPTNYVGRAEEGSERMLRNLVTSQRVNATIKVIESDSPFVERPKSRYILTEIEPASPTE